MGMVLAGGKSQRSELCPLHGGHEDLLESVVKTACSYYEDFKPIPNQLVLVSLRLSFNCM